MGEERKSGETRKKGGFGGWGAKSTLLRVPRGSAVAHCARPPHYPVACLPYSALLADGRRFETADTFFAGGWVDGWRGGWAGGAGKRKSGETRKKTADLGDQSTILSVPWGPAVVRGARHPIISLISPLPRPSDKWKAFRNRRNVTCLVDVRGNEKTKKRGGARRKRLIWRRSRIF